VIGEAHLAFENHDYTIVGVLPIGADRDTHAGVWIPIPSDAVLDTIQSGTLSLRLGANVGAASIGPQISIVAARLNKAFDV
jgi:hypothetical protein